MERQTIVKKLKLPSMKRSIVVILTVIPVCVSGGGMVGGGDVFKGWDGSPVKGGG